MTTQAISPEMPIPAPRREGGYARHTWRETIQNAMIVTRRELRDSFRDWRIMVPIFLLTLGFPALAQNLTGLATNFFVQNGAEPLMDNFLPLLPMVVGFFPVSISLVIALETFVGEKERRSLEPLLSTPLTNLELYLGKTFAATIPPLLGSYTGMTIYILSLVTGAQQWRPSAELIIQIMLLTTGQALVMVTGAVVVSSQTTSTRASNMLASFIIIPSSLLVLLESLIMVTNQRYVLWFILGGLIVADAMLFSMGARIFNREELLGRAIDQINLRWAGRIFGNQFRGGKKVKNIAQWYRYSILPTFKSLRAPVLVVIIAMFALFIGGAIFTQVRPDLQLPATMMTDRSATLSDMRATFELGHGLGIGFVLGQNLRVLLAGTILAVFSFGVMSIFLASLPFGILGFLFAQPLMAALGAGTFLAALLPHSIIEIPAIIIGSAAAARLGAIVTRPPEGKGVWEAWLGALADWAKLFIGVVIPLLIIAALIEVYITPRIVLMALGG